MKKAKKSEQRLVASILTEFALANDMEDVRRIWENLFNEYALCYDPFTKLPCTFDEYSEKEKEYNEQMMYDKYGYYVF